MGTPDILQARGREIAKVWLMGTWNGTPPVTIRHKQSCPLLMRSLNELQQAEVGEDAFDPLERKLMQELKLRIIGPVHDALDWLLTGAATIVNSAITRHSIDRCENFVDLSMKIGLCVVG
ncbi:UNVERIFIED_CONTAM: hypothetical protein Sradi_2525900 [Sesamum radiatum]|uniref:Uncharacterized protein n=1 Tax=Sesamum radiatum TaxID=300843 RepID=A0AAW2SMS4_SESRA